MSGARPVIGAFHWYSDTPLTKMNVRVATVVCALHDSVPTWPHFTTALWAEMSVPQLTITDEPTRSVRYG